MKKETASVAIRIYPSTRRKLKVKAAKEGKTLAELVEKLLNP